MAMAKKCDLCGSLYEYYDKCDLPKKEVFNGIEFIWVDAVGVVHRGYDANDVNYKKQPRLDLCTECKDRLIGLMDTIRKESGIYD